MAPRKDREAEAAADSASADPSPAQPLAAAFWIGDRLACVTLRQPPGHELSHGVCNCNACRLARPDTPAIGFD